MPEGLNHPLKDILVSKFGPLPELVSPRFKDSTYHLVDYKEQDNHLLLQEIRPGFDSTAFIDYALLNGNIPVKARREREFTIDRGGLFLHDIKAAYELGNIKTEYHLNYTKDLDDPNEPKSYVPINPNIYICFVIGNNSLNPLLAHISFIGEIPTCITLSPYDSFDELKEYKEGADKVDPNKKGSAVYESYNPHQVSFMMTVSGFESGGQILLHTNFTGRIEAMRWETTHFSEEVPFAYKASRENGNMYFQRINKQSKKTDELVVPEKIALDDFGRSMRGKLSDWAQVPLLFPVELKRTIIATQ